MTGNGHIELFKVTNYNFQPSRERCIDYIIGNVHRDYRSGDPTYGVLPTVAGCASCHSHSPENAIHLAGTGGPYLYLSNAVSCRRGCFHKKRHSLTDFHLHWKIEYKSDFSGNDYKKVVYLGEEVYMIHRPPAFSLLLRVESCN